MTPEQIACVVDLAAAPWGCRLADPDFPVRRHEAYDGYEVIIRGHGLFSAMTFAAASVREVRDALYVHDVVVDTAKTLLREAATLNRR